MSTVVSIDVTSTACPIDTITMPTSPDVLCTVVSIGDTSTTCPINTAIMPSPDVTSTVVPIDVTSTASPIDPGGNTAVRSQSLLPPLASHSFQFRQGSR